MNKDKEIICSEHSNVVEGDELEISQEELEAALKELPKYECESPHIGVPYPISRVREFCRKNCDIDRHKMQSILDDNPCLQKCIVLRYCSKLNCKEKP